MQIRRVHSLVFKLYHRICSCEESQVCVTNMESIKIYNTLKISDKFHIGIYFWNPFVRQLSHRCAQNNGLISSLWEFKCRSFVISNVV